MSVLYESGQAIKQVIKKEKKDQFFKLGFLSGEEKGIIKRYCF